jgi:energy-coupling factor transport system permease protein
MYTFGKNNGFLQKLHPVTLLAYLFVTIIGAMIVSNPVLLAGFMAVIVYGLFAAKGIGNWLRSLRIFLLMIAILLIINILVSDLGTTILWRGPVIPILGRVIISWETIVYGMVMGLRLLIVFSVFVLYNRVMDPDKALSILARIFPNSALLVALTAKSIPHMSLQLQRTAEIHQCRGVRYRTGSYISRVRNRLPLIKVLLLSSLEDSFDLAESIQARAYGSGSRSSYHRLSYGVGDALVLGCSMLAFLWIIIGMLLGWVSMEVYPKVGGLIVSIKQLLLMGTIVFLLLLPIIAARGWDKWVALRLKI